eukprot:superscaffoldBa00000031_g585
MYNFRPASAAAACQLKANNAQLMEEAVQAMQNLAQQCSDPTTVQDIVTHLFKILGEKAAAQNSQHAASVLLSRLALLDTQTESKFSSFWNLVLDKKKPLFTTEKFLSQANEENAKNVGSKLAHT